MNPLCPCSLEIESTEHYFLRCDNYVTFRTTLMNELNSVKCLLLTLSLDEIVRAILYGNKKIYDNSNFKILTATIKFMKNTQRFEQPLFWTTVFLLSLYVSVYVVKYSRFSLTIYKGPVRSCFCVVAFVF